eukprot:scaffold172651_cov23-Tisochrysis_lutea.AAC.1
MPVAEREVEHRFGVAPVCGARVAAEGGAGIGLDPRLAARVFSEQSIVRESEEEVSFWRAALGREGEAVNGGAGAALVEKREPCLELSLPHAEGTAQARCTQQPAAHRETQHR